MYLNPLQEKCLRFELEKFSFGETTEFQKWNWVGTWFYLLKPQMFCCEKWKWGQNAWFQNMPIPCSCGGFLLIPQGNEERGESQNQNFERKVIFRTGISRGVFKPKTVDLEWMWVFSGTMQWKCLLSCVSDLRELVFMNVFSISNNFCYNIIIIRCNLL